MKRTQYYTCCMTFEQDIFQKNLIKNWLLLDIMSLSIDSLPNISSSLQTANEGRLTTHHFDEKKNHLKKTNVD